MHKRILLIAALLIAVMPLNVNFAITGGASQLKADQQILGSPIEELTLTKNISHPVPKLNEVRGRKLTRTEKSSARKFKRLHKILQGPKRPKKPRSTEPTALVAFVSSLGGLLLMVASIAIFFLPGIVFLLGLASCIVGIVFGGISLKKFKNNLNMGGGKGFALAGLIIGIVAVAAILALVIAFILTF